MIFFTGDTHFGSNHAIIRDNRPFKNFKKLDKYVIKIWNKQANKNDVIYHLGDFLNYNEKDTMSWKYSLRLVKKIKAKVILIIGNNEERVVSEQFQNFEEFRQYCLNLGFKDIVICADLIINKTHFHLIHYPKDHKTNVINLFGHTHRITGLWKSYGINVCCDLNYFKLYSENDILKLIRQKNKYWDTDENITDK